jgi:Domain of unknown function (DUF5753)/Domain of unknown function (DUF397)
VILDEAALWRQAGAPKPTRQQLTALTGAAARPNVTMQLLTFTAGAHAPSPAESTAMITRLAVRDSKDPGGGHPTFSAAAWKEFTDAIKQGIYGL